MIMSVVLMPRKWSFCSTDSFPRWLNIGSYKEGSNETYTYSSLHVYRQQRGIAMKCQQRSLLTVLLLICGDIESCPGPSSLTREQFGSFLSNKGMKFVHQNIRSLTSNFDMLQEFVASHGKIDLITLSEKHISSDETGRAELLL